MRSITQHGTVPPPPCLHQNEVLSRCPGACIKVPEKSWSGSCGQVSPATTRQQCRFSWVMAEKEGQTLSYLSFFPAYQYNYPCRRQRTQSLILLCLRERKPCTSTELLPALIQISAGPWWRGEPETREAGGKITKQWLLLAGEGVSRACLRMLGYRLLGYHAYQQQD